MSSVYFYHRFGAGHIIQFVCVTSRNITLHPLAKKKEYRAHLYFLTSGFFIFQAKTEVVIFENMASNTGIIFGHTDV